MTDIPDEIVQRLVALARKITLGNRPSHHDYIEASAIVALLPEQVDPDVLVARDLVETTVHWSPQTDRGIASGRNDGTPEMKIALAGIKRGRELANQERKS